jgi:hypothetical protein
VDLARSSWTEQDLGYFFLHLQQQFQTHGNGWAVLGLKDF